MSDVYDHRDRCAIVGIGETDYSRNSGRSDLTLARQAALAAMADAGLEPAEERQPTLAVHVPHPPDDRTGDRAPDQRRRRHPGHGGDVDEAGAWGARYFSFDDCVDHHDDKLRRRLRDAAPDGFDVVFDNVGGAALDAALFNVAVRGRIALCGSISTGYRPERPEVGLHNYQLLTTRRARMEGFLLFDHREHFDHARRRLLHWVSDGRLRVEHDVLEGLERAPEGLRRLFEGRNIGKQLLHIADRTVSA